MAVAKARSRSTRSRWDRTYWDTSSMTRKSVASGRRNFSMSRMAATASSGDSERVCVPARLVNQAMGSVYRSGYSSLRTSEKSSSASEFSFTLAHGLPSTSWAFSSKRDHSPSRSRRSSKSATSGSGQ